MNGGIRKLFGVVLLLFALLIAGTVRWTVIEQTSLADNAHNRRPLLETARVPRGDIRAADGTLLAHSVKQSDGTYERRYTPDAVRASQLIGYAYVDPGRSGMEKEHHDELTGKVASASTLLSALRGNERGNDVIAALEPDVQQAALNGLAGRDGAAIAIDTQTGGVLAMASNPGFNQNDMATAAGRARIAAIPDSPRYNRVTQGGYPPASTFKVVTAGAALGTGKYTPLTIVDGSSPMTVETKTLRNFNDEDPGKITLTNALTHSVNTAFARVAEDIGVTPIADAMDAYGFGKIPLIDYPDDQILPSGLYQNGKLIPVNSDVDIARVAIGQERLRVSPMQMGLVAATIARGGEEPKLSTIKRVVDPDGRTLWSLGDGKSTGRVMSQRDAAELTAMMKQVVNEGTGTAAQLQGLSVAGKTGTAERGAVGSNIAQPWFIGFAPADNPRVAVAVTLESVANGQGGIDAAPIAKAMMEAAL